MQVFKVDWFNRLWQRAMIRIARSDGIRNIVEPMVPSSLIERYTRGSRPATGSERAKSLQGQSLRSSLFFVGEYLRDNRQCDVTVAATFEIIKQLAGIGLDVHISVDPTAIGYQTDIELCSQNAIAIATVLANASHGRPGVHCLMLDMEDESLVDYTIELHDRLREMSLPVALTMQAYLHRTPTDLQRQIMSGSRVRLVKGAFAPASKIALTSRRALSERYRQLARQMLQGTSADPPFYPIFGTHDGDIQNYIVRVAAEYGVPKQNFEFEMLMGVKPELAASLAQTDTRFVCMLRAGQIGGAM